jgi:type II secretory pathway component PulF
MRLMALLLPEAQAELWLAACREISNGERIGPGLVRMAIFPDFVVELISVGEEMGSLDSTLARAADLVEYEKVY